MYQLVSLKLLGGSNEFLTGTTPQRQEKGCHGTTGQNGKRFKAAINVYVSILYGNCCMYIYTCACIHWGGPSWRGQPLPLLEEDSGDPRADSSLPHDPMIGVGYQPRVFRPCLMNSGCPCLDGTFRTSFPWATATFILIRGAHQHALGQEIMSDSNWNPCDCNWLEVDFYGPAPKKHPVAQG